MNKTMKIALFTLSLVFSLTLSMPFSNLASAASSGIQIDDLKVQAKSDSRVEITLICSGNVKEPQKALYEDPPRIVYDFPASILRYNSGQTRRLPVKNDNFKDIAIAQFQVNPDIVRLVFYFNAGDIKSIGNSIKVSVSGNKLIFNYNPKGAPVGKPEEPAIIKPTSKNNLEHIKKLIHKPDGENVDRFLLGGSKSVYPTEVKKEKNGLLLSFKGFNFDFPVASSGKKELSIPVSGVFINEVKMINGKDQAELKVMFKGDADPSKIEYKLDKQSDSELILQVFDSSKASENLAIDEPAESPEVESLEPLTESDVFKAPETVSAEISKARQTITKIKYYPLPDGERIIFDCNGELNPVVTKLDYPVRLSLKFANTDVILPEKDTDRYQVSIDGLISNDMKVFKRGEDTTDSTVIINCKSLEQGSLKYEFYKPDKEGVYYFDFSGKPSGEQVETLDITPENEYGKPDALGVEPVDGSEQILEVEEVVPEPSIKPVSTTQSTPKPEKTSTSQPDKPKPTAKEIKPVDSSDTKNVFVTPDKESQSKNEINPFSLFMSQATNGASIDSSDQKVPVLMFVLFNKEDNSAILYMFYYEDGKLKYQRFP